MVFGRGFFGQRGLFCFALDGQSPFLFGDGWTGDSVYFVYTFRAGRDWDGAGDCLDRNPPRNGGVRVKREDFVFARDMLLEEVDAFMSLSASALTKGYLEKEVGEGEFFVHFE